MLIYITTFLSCLLLAGSARAEVSAPNCTGPNDTLAWSFNSLKQDPCLVSAYLAAACNGSAFSIAPLQSGHSYTGPNGIYGIDASDICKCNTVFYNLISACDACQGEPWITYSVWTTNCTSKATPGTFPKPVPDGTRVPKWAYINTATSNNWNSSAAQLEGDSPEVTGTASTVSHHSSDDGAIAGGVVGGIAGAALITGIALWYILRRRRDRSVPLESMKFRTIENRQSTQVSTPLSSTLANEAPKLYDPSDPTTYPSKDYLPMSNQHLGSSNHTQPSDTYSGLPEI